MPPNISIHRYIDLEHPGQHLPGIDTIFFQSSNTQTFADDKIREDFRERWLGRYLHHDPNWFYVAIEGETQDVAGYLAGSIEDPAQSDRFTDIPYFKTFADLTSRFPAHLHVNVAQLQRGSGIGASLVEAFCQDACSAGAPGVHVVTSAGARNVGFYERNGFTMRSSAGNGANGIVFLARQLSSGK